MLKNATDAAPLPLVLPDWPAPARVRACSSTRLGGVSKPPFDALNLGFATADEPDAVAANRARLASALDLPESPRWLAQEHGTRVLDAAAVSDRPAADASIARAPGLVCAVLTADCIPVLLCDARGRQVAAAHAGWRGLAAGVLEAAVAAFDEPPQNLLAWLGPGIGPRAFEVGPEVREAFVRVDPDAARGFRPSRGDRLLADLYQLAASRLGRAGIGKVFGGGYCSFSEPKRFYSHRRDGAGSGRMASLIWIQP